MKFFHLKKKSMSGGRKEGKKKLKKDSQRVNLTFITKLRNLYSYSSPAFVVVAE
jgi:hypothetical protein